MDRNIEKLLYSRRDTAEALSLSVRSVDYLITAGRLPARRVGGKILIPANAVRRFAREDHPEGVRVGRTAKSSRFADVDSAAGNPRRGFGPISERSDDQAATRANGQN
jgi:excisionase family DNA binding protein